jgi:hypothetical protein
MKTMKQVTAAMIATFGVLAFEANAAAEQKFQKLTGAQIQAKFPGMELTDEAHWGEIFKRNGTLTITSWATRAPAAGLCKKTSFASTPEKNQAEAATRFGFPEKT